MSAILTAPLELIYPVHRFSVEDYHKMIDIGILGDEDRVELLDGKIIEMSPIGPFHAACVSKLAKFFFRHIANDYSCRQEQPITITVGSEPEPDFIVATYRKDEYATGHPHPQDIHLLIEVADKTLERDRTAKAIIYARAGIPEYWIVNLIDRQLEIYTDPDPTTGKYDNQRIIAEEATLEHHLTGKLPLRAILP